MDILFQRAIQPRSTPFCVFSDHALERILPSDPAKKRTSLTPEAIADILDSGMAVYTGHEAGTYRAHMLFYSPPDDRCLVAVQDVLSGYVVTILPLNYHQNLAYKIKDEQQIEAKQRYIEMSRKRASMSRCIHVLVHYTDNGKRKSKKLMKFNSSDFGFDLMKFKRAKPWKDSLLKAVIDAEITPSSIYTFSARVGSKGEQFPIDSTTILI